MKLRMIIATFAVTALAACGSTEDDQPKASPSSEAPSSSATTPAPSESTDSASPAQPGNAPKKAADLVGTWSDPKAKWTVRFKANGTYDMDYQGVKSFMHGKYSLKGTSVSLSNDEGTDRGTVKGSSIVFRLGTLTRK